MATPNKTTNVKNLVVDKSSRRQIRIMEDTLVAILTPYVQKLSKNKNWYSPLLLLAGSVLSLVRINYAEIIIKGDKGEYLGVDGWLITCVIIYSVLVLVALFLIAYPLITLYKQRKEDLSAQGILKEIISLPTTDEDCIKSEK